MTSTTTRIRTTAALATAVLGLAVAAQPAGAAGDLRSPDARDAATLSQPPTPTDLRTPDAVDAAVAPRIDLRSPDAADAGRPVQQPPAHVEDAGSGGFAWAYLAVGGLALALLGGTVATTQHRRHRVGHPSVTRG